MLLTRMQQTGMPNLGDIHLQVRGTTLRALTRSIQVSTAADARQSCVDALLPLRAAWGFYLGAREMPVLRTATRCVFPPARIPDAIIIMPDSIQSFHLILGQLTF